MKKTIFASLLFMFALLSIKATQYTCRLVITDSMFVYNGYGSTKYVFPSMEYTYAVKTNSGIQGSGVGNFTIKLTNGTFVNGGSTELTITENFPFKIKWNDVSENGEISINQKNSFFPSDTINSGTPMSFSYQIASLKGQTPTILLQNTNPQMGNAQPFTAQLAEDMVYSGVYVSNGWGGSTNLKADDYEWTLPPGWGASGGRSGTFTLSASESKNGITITPDHFSTGELKVRAVNLLGTAGSEYKTYSMDRGFTRTYPQSISFGDNTTKTFAMTAYSGVIYEWSVPSGWQINGQGSTVEAVNLNSVSVTPNFCVASNDPTIKVRLKKDNAVSQWFVFPTQIASADIVMGASTIYQYEEALFTLQNIEPSDVQSINFSGNGVIYLGAQESGYRVFFSTTGNIDLSASVLLNGCATTFTLTKQVAVSPTRIAIVGPPTFYSTGTFTINNLPANATVSAQTSYGHTTSVSGNVITVTRASSGGSYFIYDGDGWLQATLTFGAQIFPLNQVRFISGEFFGAEELTIYHPREHYGTIEEMPNWCSDNNYTQNKVRMSLMDADLKPYMHHIRYQLRLKRQSTHAVVYTMNYTFNGDVIPLFDVSTETPLYNEFENSFYVAYEEGTPSQYYDIEMRIVSYSKDTQWEYNLNGDWHYVGTALYENCSSSNYTAQSAAYTIFPNPSGGTFTLQRTLAEEESLSTQSTSLLSGSGQSNQTETLKLQFYSLPMGVFVKEMTVEVSDVASINSGISQPGNYLVRVLKDNVPVASVPISIE
jgi:hypothetical protein